MDGLILAEHLPLEQGLRLGDCIVDWERRAGLAEHLPLEQGLRLFTVLDVNHKSIVLAEHFPLEQGLRPPSRRLVGSCPPTRRASSIRTRIKTVHNQRQTYSPHRGSQSIFH